MSEHLERCEILVRSYTFISTNIVGDHGIKVSSASESNHSKDVHQAGQAPIQIQALISYFERILDRKLEAIHDQLD